MRADHHYWWSALIVCGYCSAHAQSVLPRVDDLVGDACARHELVLIVVDFDVVARGGAAEVCWGAYPAYTSGDSGTVVGDVEVNTYRDFPLEA